MNATHDHHHHDDIDWAAMAGRLEREAETHRDATVATLRWLRELPRDDRAPGIGRILDVGSGSGVDACLFAEQFPDAGIVAVDHTAELLDLVRERAASAGLGDRVTTRRAELPDEVVSLESADLIWSRRTVHHVGDQQEGLAGLASRLRPGGLLAVAEGGLTQRFLPRDFGLGRPGLQERLDVVIADAFSEMRAGLPGSVPVVEDWPAMLARAGLVPTGSRTFLTEWTAPLDERVRAYLHGHLDGLRDRVGDRLDATDRETLDALVDGDAPTGILWRPDAFYLSASTVHTARSRA